MSVSESNELAFSIIDREFEIPRVITSNDSVKLENVDSKIWLSYLEQICEVFRGEIPHVMHPQMDIEKLRETKRNVVAPDFSRLLKYNPGHARQSISPNKEAYSELPRRIRKTESPAAKQSGISTLDVQSRRARKRRSHEKSGNIVRIEDFLLVAFSEFIPFNLKCIRSFVHTKHKKNLTGNIYSLYKLCGPFKLISTTSDVTAHELQCACISTRLPHILLCANAVNLRLIW